MYISGPHISMADLDTHVKSISNNFEEIPMFFHTGR